MRAELPNFHMCRNHQGPLFIKCRFWSRRSGVGPRFCISPQLLGVPVVSGSPSRGKPPACREKGPYMQQPCARCCSSCPWCRGKPREGFRISLQRGGLRIRKLSWMSGNEGIVIKKARLHNEGVRKQVWRRGRCEEVNGSLLVTSSGPADLAWVVVSVWGRRAEGREFGDLITKCCPPC